MCKYVLSILAGTTIALAQTTVNPDVSVIGDLIIEGDQLTTSGVELAVQAYVNPFARAHVFLHKYANDKIIDLEEAFLSVERGLPFNMGLRSGLLRPDLGKINREHEHTYPFIVAPKAAESTLGENKWSFLGLATLCIFVFCSVDLFHTGDYVVGQSHGKASNPDTCPVCMFKASTNSTQPLYTNPILPSEMAWINMVAHPAILLSIELACRLSIRAPPSNITC